MAADFLESTVAELVIVGSPDDPGTIALKNEVARVYLPNRIIAHVNPGDPSSAAVHERQGSPLLKGKTMVDGKPALYVCQGYTCEKPITKVSEVAERLNRTAFAGAGGRGLGRAQVMSMKPCNPTS